MNTTSFKIAELSKKLKELQEKTFQLLEDNNKNELKEQLKTELEELKTRDKLKIAFVGQYSSGKSTIISALTGNKDIKIDADVATDKVSEYNWNNIILMDTPGILAGKNESHDLSTKNALKECDLIVYVLTSNLFDDVVFRNFIDLAYDQHFSDKMLIAINKMSMENGEFDQLVNTYSESIKSTFAQKGLDFNYPIVYIDAADYIEGVDTQDDEFVELSHFSSFINKLNVFVQEKGLIKKELDTPVRKLKQCVADLAVEDINPNLETYFSQCNRTINNSRNGLVNSIRSIVSSYRTECLTEIYRFSDFIGVVQTEDELKERQDELNYKLETGFEKSVEQIDNVINENYEFLENEIEDLENRDSIRLFKENLKSKINAEDISFEEKKNYEKQLEILNGIGDKCLKFSELVTNGGSVKLQGVAWAAGSQVHNGVLAVGHFFGNAFKPWEAVNVAATIGKFVAIIPIAASAFQIWSKYKNSKETNEREEKIRNSKKQCIEDYKKIVEEKCQGILKEIDKTVISNYNELSNYYNSKKIEFAELSQKNNRLMDSIKRLSVEYNDFIEIIENKDSHKH